MVEQLKMESAKMRLQVAPRVEKSKVKITLSELEQKVLDFIKSTKLVGSLDMPVFGATTVEVQQAFPEINGNTIRYTVWRLRVLQLVTDAGHRRSLEKGKQKLVVWTACAGVS
jgi:hypothetical protein